MQTWQLQEAKAKFSDLVRQTVHSPQTITVRGEPVAVLLSIKKYRSITKPRQNLCDFLQSSPLADVNIDLSRDQSANIREVDL
ncbi:antitoxin [Fibrobacterales bacterium]|nr:antitoxin [Fibrobacterales bacterium]